MRENNLSFCPRCHIEIAASDIADSLRHPQNAEVWYVHVPKRSLEEFWRKVIEKSQDFLHKEVQNDKESPCFKSEKTHY